MDEPNEFETEQKRLQAAEDIFFHAPVGSPPTKLDQTSYALDLFRHETKQAAIKLRRWREYAQRPDCGVNPRHAALYEFKLEQMLRGFWRHYRRTAQEFHALRS